MKHPLEPLTKLQDINKKSHINSSAYKTRRTSSHDNNNKTRRTSPRDTNDSRINTENENKIRRTSPRDTNDSRINTENENKIRRTSSHDTNDSYINSPNENKRRRNSVTSQDSSTRTKRTSQGSSIKTRRLKGSSINSANRNDDSKKFIYDTLLKLQFNKKNATEYTDKLSTEFKTMHDIRSSIDNYFRNSDSDSDLFRHSSIKPYETSYSSNLDTDETEYVSPINYDTIGTEIDSDLFRHSSIKPYKSSYSSNSDTDETEIGTEIDPGLDKNHSPINYDSEGTEYPSPNDPFWNEYRKK
jgi:hypothetical protein